MLPESRLSTSIVPGDDVNARRRVTTSRGTGDVESPPVAGLFTESNEKEDLIWPLIKEMRGQPTRTALSDSAMHFVRGERDAG